jgi:hypothetical protein
MTPGPDFELPCRFRCIVLPDRLKASARRGARKTDFSQQARPRQTKYSKCGRTHPRNAANEPAHSSKETAHPHKGHHTNADLPVDADAPLSAPLFHQKPGLPRAGEVVCPKEPRIQGPLGCQAFLGAGPVLSRHPEARCRGTWGPDLGKARATNSPGPPAPRSRLLRPLRRLLRDREWSRRVSHGVSVARPVAGVFRQGTGSRTPLLRLHVGGGTVREKPVLHSPVAGEPLSGV